MPNVSERLDTQMRFEKAKQDKAVRDYIRALFTHHPRLVINHSGRRSWKSELVKRMLVHTATDPQNGKHNYLVLCPTLNQCIRLYWQDLKELSPVNLVTDISESSHTILYVNGSQIIVDGCDKGMRSDGSLTHGVVLDEAGDSRDVFSSYIRPRLADTGGWCVLLGVSRSTFSPWYKNLVRDVESGRYPDATSFSWSSEGFLPEKEVAEIKATTHPLIYRREYGGEFTELSSKAFDFTEEHLCEKSWNLNQAINVGLDFNVGLMSWSLWSTDGRTVHTHDAVTDRETNVYKMCSLLKNKLIDICGGEQRAKAHRVNLYGDASGRSKDSVAPATAWDAIQQQFHGWNLRTWVPSSNPPVSDRLLVANTMLRAANGTIRWTVSKKCEELVKDLDELTREQMEWSPKKQSQGERTHAVDGMTYGLWFEFRLDKPTMRIRNAA